MIDKLLDEYLNESTNLDGYYYITPDQAEQGDMNKGMYLPLMGGDNVKDVLKTIHGNIKVMKPAKKVYKEAQYRKAFDDMDAFSLSFHTTSHYIEDPDRIYLYKDRELNPQHRSPDGVELKNDRDSEVLKRLDFYMKSGDTETAGVQVSMDKLFSKSNIKTTYINSKKVDIKESERCDIYRYDSDMDITLQLVDRSDELGVPYRVIEENQYEYFVMEAKNYGD
jgi:hypothetical protein